MKLAEQRDIILAALAGVPGLSVTPVAPAVIVAGAAWTVWRDVGWVNAATITARWFVVVAVPGGSSDAAVDAADEYIHTVGDALIATGLIGVTLVDPVGWPVEPGGQTVPVLRFALEF